MGWSSKYPSWEGMCLDFFWRKNYEYGIRSGLELHWTKGHLNYTHNLALKQRLSLQKTDEEFLKKKQRFVHEDCVWFFCLMVSATFWGCFCVYQVCVCFFLAFFLSFQVPTQALEQRRQSLPFLTRWRFQHWPWRWTRGPCQVVPSVTRNVTCCRRQFWMNQLFLPRARGEMGLFESEASGVTVGCTSGFDKFNQISQVNIGMHRQTQVLWIIESTMLRLWCLCSCVFLCPRSQQIAGKITTNINHVTSWRAYFRVGSKHRLWLHLILQDEITSSSMRKGWERWGKLRKASIQKGKDEACS